MLPHHDSIPSHLLQSGSTFFLLVLPCGQKGFLQRYQHLSALMFPPSLWSWLDFYHLGKAEGCCPYNGMNPVYLFVFIVLKYEMFVLYNHPPPDVAQRSSTRSILSIHPSKEEVPLSPAKPSQRCTKANLAERAESSSPEQIIPLGSGRFGLAFMKLAFIFSNSCCFLTAYDTNDVLLYVCCIYMCTYQHILTHFLTQEERPQTFSILSCLCRI